MHLLSFSERTSFLVVLLSVATGTLLSACQAGPRLEGAIYSVAKEAKSINPSASSNIESSNELLSTGPDRTAVSPPASVSDFSGQTEVRVISAVDASGSLSAGFTLGMRGDEVLDCPGISSPAATGPNIHSCAPTVAEADVCWGRVGTTRLYCSRNPLSTVLHEYTSRELLSEVAAPETPIPWGLQLETGLDCRLRNGGAWSTRPDGLNGVYVCSNTESVVVADTLSETIDSSSLRWKVRVGTLPPSPASALPASTVEVDVAYFAR